MSYNKYIIAILIALASPLCSYAADEAAEGSGPNPRITVEGNFLYINSNNPANTLTSNTSGIRDSGIEFIAELQPNMEAAFELSFPTGGTPSVEEALINFNELPLGLAAKVGTFRSGFNRINTIGPSHRKFFGNPLYIDSFFGDSMIESGISVTAGIPHPWTGTSELKMELANGDNAVSFGSTVANHAMTGVFSFSNIFKLGPHTGLQIGISDAYGLNNTPGNFYTNLLGGNILFVGQNDMGGILTIEGEYLSSTKNISTTTATLTDGYFGYIGYSPFSAIEAGVRYDDSAISPVSVLRQKRISPVITYHVSNAVYFRVQYNNITQPNQVINEEIMAQMVFVIGAETTNEDYNLPLEEEAH